MAALAHERHCGVPGAAFTSGSLLSVSSPDAHFDASFAMRTLQYLDEPLRALRELARVTRPGGRVVVVEGGMSVIDLPSPELASRVLGERWDLRRHSFGVELYRLLREAGLVRVRVIPVTTVEHKADAVFLDFARRQAEGAAEAGVATAEELADWLRQVEGRSTAGDWFAAECLMVVVGTVAKTR